MYRLTGSPIEWQEAEEELVLHLPPRAGRMAGPLLWSAAFFTLFEFFIIYESDGWLPAVVGMAAVLAILLFIAYAKMRATYLTDTGVTITPERVIVKTSWGGRETEKKFPLKPGSRAWQWYLRQTSSRKYDHRPQGIVVADQTYNQERGDDPGDRSKPRFGGNLAAGEMDWVEWRVNLFLDRNGHAAQAELNEEAGLSEPQKGLVRIEQDGLETRIAFPNTMATGSFTGVWILLIGLVLLALSCAPLMIIWNDAEEMNWPQMLKMLAYLGVFGFLGVAGTSNGLVRLFGKRQLAISPRRVRYSANVLGIGVPMTLPTAEIVSVWDPSKRVATRRPHAAMASAPGAVIRTARREMPLRAAQDALGSGTAARWLAEEITRHIVSAREKLAVGAAVV
ncbi:MAG TPA: hypothetical protein VHE81_07185 [Lacipirellulaceae bacterium]|nr:hypothetical protein [Lacipirellulaceae bacterium]